MGFDCFLIVSNGLQRVFHGFHGALGPISIQTDQVIDGDPLSAGDASSHQGSSKAEANDVQNSMDVVPNSIAPAPAPWPSYAVRL